MIYTTNVTLQWQPGIYAAKHDVYIGTSFADVNNANTSTPGIYKGRQDPNNYPVTGLTPGQPITGGLMRSTVSIPGKAMSGALRFSR